MATNENSLTDIFLEVSDDGTITEYQESGPSHDPVEGNAVAVEQEVRNTIRSDGLDDAVEGAEGTGGTAVTG